MAGACEGDSKHPASIKCEEFLEYLKTVELLTKDSVELS